MLERVNVSANGEVTSDPHYAVTVSHPDSTPRNFIAFYYPRTWEVGVVISGFLLFQLFTGK